MEARFLKGALEQAGQARPRLRRPARSGRPPRPRARLRSRRARAVAVGADAAVVPPRARGGDGCRRPRRRRLAAEPRVPVRVRGGARLPHPPRRHAGDRKSRGAQLAAILGRNSALLLSDGTRALLLSQAAELLLDHGVDLTDAAHKLSSRLPKIISVPFDNTASHSVLQATMGDLAAAVRAARPVPLADRAEWEAQRRRRPRALWERAMQRAGSRKGSRRGSADDPPFGVVVGGGDDAAAAAALLRRRRPCSTSPTLCPAPSCGRSESCLPTSRAPRRAPPSSSSTAVCD